MFNKFEYVEWEKLSLKGNMHDDILVDNDTIKKSDMLSFSGEK